MKIPTSGSGNDYGTETDIITYMENNFEPDLDGPEAETSSDFSEYLWMENEEEFDKEVIQQLMEEELTEECLKAMWEDEKQLERNSIDNEIWQQLDRLSLPDDITEWSTLNPNAAEFVPAFKPAVTSVSTPPEVTAESS